MTLQSLLDALDIDTEVLGPREVDITGLTTDSRRVRPGDLFFALVGQHENAHRFVPEAVDRGAAAVVALHVDPTWGPMRVPVVITSDVRRCLGLMAAHFSGAPSRQLTAVAVTGTNGKTSVTYLVEAMWRAHGLPAGVIGTINYRHGSAFRPAPLTTPDALDLQAELAAMVAAGVRGVAVEVSSHALAFDRARGVHWDAAVFTNLSHDHLDFHKDLENYYRAKARLFLEHLPSSAKPDPAAVINVDDARGARLAREVGCRLITFGRDPAATVHPRAVEQGLDGLRGSLSVAGEPVEISSPLIGEQHVYNIMAAAGAAHAIGLPRQAIEAGIRACSAVPGRLERVDGVSDFAVFVDYAHTPHALETVLGSLRSMCAGRVVTVFGCGGCRDRAKRPVMGEIAGRLSDVVVLTSDNPRTEDPEAILQEIEPGLAQAGRRRLASEALAAGETGYARDADRRRAIELALRLARPGDIVLIAGKGHEDYQIVGHERRPFDDRAVAQQLLRERYEDRFHAVR